MPSDRKGVAHRALALLDLTDLSDTANAAAAERLAARAETPFGSVAALCVFPAFVRAAKEALRRSPVKVATVVNFPGGDEDSAAVEREIECALGDGADEIDLVMPYRAFLAGRAKEAEKLVADARTLIPGRKLLKVILETGELRTETAIADAARLAIGAGADMLKTSTGKVKVNATPRAAEVMLSAIRNAERRVGFKAAGGIRTLETAASYFEIADRVMGPEWARPKTFRLGASGLLDELIEVLVD